MMFCSLKHDAFYNLTGCLRKQNVSWLKLGLVKAMRNGEFDNWFAYRSVLGS